MQTRGSILVGLLWCIAILAVVVVGLLHASTLELRVVKNHGDLIQAHYLAVAGIEKAKALLYHDAYERRGTGHNHTGDLYDAPQHFRDVELGRGRFQVIRQGYEGGEIIYGVSDEESRLNLNSLSADALGKLHGMTPEAALLITGYRENVLPFRTIRELLFLRDLPREYLFGEDRNLNGLIDPGESGGANGSFGWGALLTIHSSVRNDNAFGKPRIDIQSADETALAEVEGISPELAKAIVEYREQNSLDSLADLLDVRQIAQESQAPSQAPGNQPQGQPGGSGPQQIQMQPQVQRAPQPQSPQPSSPQGPQPGRSGGRPSGPQLISEDLFMEIADALTVDSEPARAGVVNINTAEVDALICLPRVERQLAQAIVSHRQSNGYFSNIAELLRVPGMNREIFKELAPRVSARSETFRILSEGRIEGTGARKRIQVIVRVGLYDVETLAYREDDL